MKEKVISPIIRSTINVEDLRKQQTNAVKSGDKSEAQKLRIREARLMTEIYKQLDSNKRKSNKSIIIKRGDRWYRIRS